MDISEIAKRLGITIREMRKEQVCTQAKLHNLTGIPIGRISYAERGGEKFSRGDLIKIGLVLGNEIIVAQLLKMAEMEPLISEELLIHKNELASRSVSKPEFSIPHNHLTAVQRMPHFDNSMFIFLNKVAEAADFPLSSTVCAMLLKEREEFKKPQNL